MIKKNIILILLFYFLVIIQTSFLVHFEIFSRKWIGLLVIFIPLLLINLFEIPEKKSGVVAAAFAGFFIDVFSSGFFSVYLLTAIIFSLLIKFILRRYVRFPVFKKT